MHFATMLASYSHSLSSLLPFLRVLRGEHFI